MVLTHELNASVGVGLEDDIIQGLADGLIHPAKRCQKFLVADSPPAQI
jgi:hypothetical protein